MKNLYLVRHGESIQNVGLSDALHIPDHAAYLTERGMYQAHAAGEFLAKALKDEPPDYIAVYVSPYERTRQTAKAILDHLTVSSVKEDEMLTELQFGVFDGLSKAQAEERFPAEWAQFQASRRYNGKFYARRPGGESPLDCEIRPRLFLDSLRRDFAHGCPDHIIIVGHGAALNILRKAVFGYSHEWYEAEPNPGNCSIQLLRLNNYGLWRSGRIGGDAAPTPKDEDAGYIYGGPAEKEGQCTT